MIQTNVYLNVDDSSPLEGVKPENIVIAGKEVSFVRVPNGMKSGKSSVSIVAPLADGKFVFLECSMDNFEMVAAAMKAAESL